MDGREDSVLSDSPPSAGEPDSDYEAPARIKQTLKPRRRSKPRVALRSRKRRVSQTSFQLDEEDPDVFEDQVLLDVVDDDSDLEDARVCPTSIPALHSFSNSSHDDETNC